MIIFFVHHTQDCQTYNSHYPFLVEAHAIDFYQKQLLKERPEMKEIHNESDRSIYWSTDHSQEKLYIEEYNIFA